MNKITPSRKPVNADELKRYLHRFSEQEFNINVFGKSRKREYTFERMSCMYVIHSLCRLSLAKVDYVCSNGKPRDHATALHAIRKVESEATMNIYKDREHSVNIWHNVVLRYLARDINLPAEMKELLEKIEHTLQMSDRERELLEEVKKIVMVYIYNNYNC